MHNSSLERFSKVRIQQIIHIDSKEQYIIDILNELVDRCYRSSSKTSSELCHREGTV